ncbi:hypothetical protein NRS6141_04350 [Bacillus subtilis]|nr:hypothetical protein NRS6141_04350 [Bacillus subtilis]CAF1880981.1 hypothetical protein NRS6204_00656 [Bacillus subtilis]CAF1918913.1 hypothetical protein NRS6205_04350 [Bacillus subtilis]
MEVKDDFKCLNGGLLLMVIDFTKKIRDSKNEDTKSYWYLFCFRFIKFPSGVHDLSPNACVNLLITQCLKGFNN